VLRHQRGAAWRRLTDIFSPKAGLISSAAQIPQTDEPSSVESYQLSFWNRPCSLAPSPLRCRMILRPFFRRFYMSEYSKDPQIVNYL
jgi:hypothetical protein